MTYSLGKSSLAELTGVHSDLVRVVKRAIEITACDFTVHDGIRTVEEQKRYVAEGVSKTMRSKHLEGCAVDLVPVINGKPRWEWPPIYRVAEAMHKAADECGVRLIWGGVWDHRLDELPAFASGLEAAVAAYTARRRAMGKKAFIDGPHFELAP